MSFQGPWVGQDPSAAEGGGGLGLFFLHQLLKVIEPAWRPHTCSGLNSLLLLLTF